MANDELPQTLEKLHAELSQSPHVNDQTLRSLRTLLDEIQAVIARADVGEPEESLRKSSLTERFRELIVDFEVRHPQLTATVSQIADRLSDMGI